MVDIAPQLHAVIYLHNKLAVVHRNQLVSVLNLWHRGHNNIGKHDFIWLRARHDRWPSEIVFKLLEGYDTFFSSFKPLPLVDQ